MHGPQDDAPAAGGKRDPARPFRRAGRKAHGEARELEDETLEIRVCDNGAGLPEALLGPYRPPEKQTRHLGLFNVDTILKKHYGERFGLRLDNRTDGTGACITARLPVRRRDAE